MNDDDFYPSIPPFGAGIRGQCPRCGQGHMFSGFLKLADKCNPCGLEFDFADSGDGPAVFIMLVVGFVIVAAALFVEVAYQPPYWLHAILWLPLAIILPLALLRPMKGVLIAQQYHAKAAPGQLED